MTVLTGADGFMRVDGRKIGKVRNFSISIQRDATDITSLSEYDRTFIHGLRNTTGSCTLFYDPADQFANKFLNSIFESDHQQHEVDFVLNKNGLNANWNYVPKPWPWHYQSKHVGHVEIQGHPYEHLTVSRCGCCSVSAVQFPMFRAC